MTRRRAPRDQAGRSDGSEPGLPEERGATAGEAPPPEGSRPSGGGPPSRLRDVARVAGVSLPTASQALNGHARISTATRRRVQQAARQLHYTPNAAARRLILGRSDSVAIVPGLNMTGIFSDLFYRAVLTGVGSVFEQVGYRMLIAPPLHPDERAPQFVRMAQGREIDGAIVVGVVDRRWILEATDSGVPVVLLDNDLPDLPVPAVVNDNAGGAYAATRHLAALGHTRIAFLGAAVDYAFGRETHSGYTRALRDAGVPRDPELEILVRIDADAARREAEAFFTLSHPPTAVFAVTDILALGVINAARERGLRIPRDLSVVGMDDIELAAVTDPPLTTVRIPKEKMGQRAARILLDLVRGRAAEQKTTVFPNTLIQRGTTGGYHERCSG
ncbi:MAG TPA: LacI family DNA-binding transcriptional regulator [bacterium]|nr:LacI family DNA-binding transcriptional regulator [bacterium]